MAAIHRIDPRVDQRRGYYQVLRARACISRNLFYCGNARECACTYPRRHLAVLVHARTCAEAESTCAHPPPRALCFHRASCELFHCTKHCKHKYLHYSSIHTYQLVYEVAQRLLPWLPSDAAARTPSSYVHSGFAHLELAYRPYGNRRRPGSFGLHVYCTDLELRVSGRQTACRQALRTSTGRACLPMSSPNSQLATPTPTPAPTPTPRL
jgi:hypothetical protein